MNGERLIALEAAVEGGEDGVARVETGVGIDRDRPPAILVGDFQTIASGIQNAESLRKGGGGLGVRQRQLILPWKANNNPIGQGQNERPPGLDEEEEGEYDDGAEKEGERPQPHS